MSEVEKNSLEKIILAGIGAITKTAETAGELLEELVKKGELTIEQGKALNEELKYNKAVESVEPDEPGEPDQVKGE